MTTASTERVFKLGAKAVCKDCSRPTVTAGVWALVVALHEAGKKADIALFATEAEADAPFVIGELDTFGIHLYWTVFCLYLDCIL